VKKKRRLDCDDESFIHHHIEAHSTENAVLISDRYADVASNIVSPLPKLVIQCRHTEVLVEAEPKRVVDLVERPNYAIHQMFFSGHGLEPTLSTPSLSIKSPLVSPNERIKSILMIPSMGPASDRATQEAMAMNHRIIRITTLSAALVTLGACSSAGGLGEVLGSVLGGGTPAAQQLSGSVRTVDTRNQQISVQQPNGQAVAVLYDQNTKVVYQNKLYAVTNLEAGDQILARIQTTQNNAYYTDSIFVTQAVTTTTSTGTVGSESVQQLQGTVRSVDRNNGTFVLDASSNVSLTISMPYRPTTADANKFNSLRVGDYVRLSGVYLNNSRVELRQFY
jgi:hypothetical protein